MSRIAFYNDCSLHQALGGHKPMAAWRERMHAAKVVDKVSNSEIESNLQRSESGVISTRTDRHSA